jgi:hypothetical protein
MKKTYIRPETQVVNIHTEGMIAASLAIRNNGTVDTSVDGAQLSNKKDPIWGTDEENTEKGGIW